MDWLIGSIDETAERELANYKPGKGRTKSFGDRIGDALTGRGAAVDKAVEDLYVENLEKSYGTTIRELNNTPGASPLTIDKNTDGRVLKQQIDLAQPKAQRFKDAMQQAALNDVVIDTSQIQTPEAIYQKIVSTNKTRKKDDEKEARERRNTETIRQETRDDRISADNRALLAQQRTADLELRRDNMEMQYAAMARRDRIDAKDRRDKNIMFLMRGLEGIAQGFTV